MNIAFFLLPKKEVAFLSMESTLRQTLEKMEFHRYTAVPILNSDGEYMGTVTEGDLLWFIKNTTKLSFEEASKYSLSDVPLRLQNKSVLIDSNMEDLITLVKAQNFVPVVDDTNKFIGIVRRSEVIDYCAKTTFREMDSAMNAKQ
jgi:CBS domain-containing protein